MVQQLGAAPPAEREVVFSIAQRLGLRERLMMSGHVNMVVQVGPHGGCTGPAVGLHGWCGTLFGSVAWTLAQRRINPQPLWS